MSRGRSYGPDPFRTIRKKNGVFNLSISAYSTAIVVGITFDRPEKTYWFWHDTYNGERVERKPTWREFGMSWERRVIASVERCFANAKKSLKRWQRMEDEHLSDKDRSTLALNRIEEGLDKEWKLVKEAKIESP